MEQGSLIFFFRYLKRETEFMKTISGYYQKMMLLVPLLLLTIFSCTTSVAQQLRGQLKDQQTGEAIPYVNIGILRGGTGTVSDEAGYFSLRIDSAADADTVRISMLGYQPYSNTLRHFKTLLQQEGNVITMTKSSIALREATIRSRELKERKLGNFTSSEHISAGFSSNDLGCELVIKIKAKRSPTYLESFHFAIARSIYDTLLFRLNVYTIVDDMPGEQINTRNIYVTTTAQKGWVRVDLRDYNIMAEDDFAIGLEFVSFPKLRPFEISVKSKITLILNRQNEEIKIQRNTDCFNYQSA